MNRPESFILTSDYATLKNDDSMPTQSVSLPAQILSANQLVTVTQDFEVGQKNASSRIRMASVKDGSDYYTCYVLSLNRTGQIAGPINVPYNVYGFVGRISPEVVRLSISVKNPYNEGMGMAFGTETILFELSTFLSPFIN